MYLDIQGFLNDKREGKFQGTYSAVYIQVTPKVNSDYNPFVAFRGKMLTEIKMTTELRSIEDVDKLTDLLYTLRVCFTHNPIGG